VTNRRNSPGKTVLLVVMTLPFLYPFAFLVATALKPLPEFQEDKLGWPDRPSFENISAVWDEVGLGQAMLNSLLAVGVGVVVTVLISAAGAFWFLQHHGRAANVLRSLVLLTMALPPPVFIIPLFVLMSAQGLTNNLLALGIVYAGWNAAFGLYLMHAYYRALPLEVLEAARVDGASLLQQFFYIILPLSRPALATLGVLAFLWSWSDLLLSVVLIQDPERRTVTVATALLADQYSTNIPKNAAGVLLALIPILAIFLLGQRYLARGIAAGVGK